MCGHGTAKRVDLSAKARQEVAGITVCSMKNFGCTNGTTSRRQDVRMCGVAWVIRNLCYWGVGLNGEPGCILLFELGPNFGYQSVRPKSAIWKENGPRFCFEVVLLRRRLLADMQNRTSETIRILTSASSSAVNT